MLLFDDIAGELVVDGGFVGCCCWVVVEGTGEVDDSENGILRFNRRFFNDLISF